MLKPSQISSQLVLGCVIAIASLLLAADVSAAVITGWDYNAETNIGDASVGTGTTMGGGSFPFTNTLPNSNGSSADPGTLLTGGLNNQEWTRRGPNAGEDDATRTTTWTTSTAGYEDIVFEWDMVAGNQTSRYYQILSTTDGTNFSPVSGGAGTGATTAGVGSATVDSTGLITVIYEQGYEPDPSLDPVNPVDYLFDLTYAFPSGAAEENNPNFAVQIAAVFGPGNTDYVSSFGGTSADYSRTGGTRYDLVTISGAPVPEPAGFALIASALVSLGLLRRRRN